MNYILLFIIIPKKIYTFIIMSTYIQNYGFTKTYIKGKHNKTQPKQRNKRFFNGFK